MSYQTYTTEAIVCGARPQVGADMAYLLFTQDHGMVWATARSVREERSRQRYALQPFGHVRVSLVKGKSGWRIGSVEALGNAFMSAQKRSERHLLSQCVATVRRFVRGEGAQGAIYRDLADLCLAVAQHEPHAPAAGLCFTIRTLMNLGYLAPEPAFVPITSAPVWYQVDVSLSDTARARVREAEQVSHL
jgi:recombinational DNA repair protein (RecF pathway)